MGTLNPSEIEKIYIGRDVGCRCGCGGDYIYPNSPEFGVVLLAFEERKLLYGLNAEPRCDDVFQNVSFGNNQCITVYFI